MKRLLRIYRAFVIQNFKILKQSRVNLLIGVFTFILLQGINIALIEMIYDKVPDIHGFTKRNLLLLYGIFLIPRGIDHIVSDYLWVFSGNGVRRGIFDRALVRPIEPLFHVIIERFDFNGFSELILGFVLMIYNVDIQNLTASSILLFIFTIFNGIFIYMGIKIIFASLAFWIKNSFFVLELCYSTSEYSRYPLDVFSMGIQGLLLYLLPFAFTSYIPYLILNNYEVGTVKTLMSLFIGYIIMFFAYKIWKAGERVYESTGS